MDREAALRYLRSKRPRVVTGVIARYYPAVIGRLTEAGRDCLGQEMFDALAFQPRIGRAGLPIIPLLLDNSGYPIVRLAPFPVIPSFIASGKWLVRIERVTPEGAVEALYLPAPREAALQFIAGALR